MSDTHVYAVAMSPGGLNVYVEASSKQKARSAALKDVSVRRLNGGEIRSLYEQGKAITVAADTAQPELPGATVDQTETP